MSVHQPLSRARSEIRLIRFIPDSADHTSVAPIQLELRHASLTDKKLEYSALSYVWGLLDETTAVQIYINGDPFTVGCNLHDALLQLRESVVDSWLWIDAICVQQSDDDEKTWQVGQMRAVFTEASVVYSWLGLGCDITDEAMDFISQVGSRALALGLTELYSDNEAWPDAHNSIYKRLSSMHQEPWAAKRGIEDEAPWQELSEFVHELSREPRLARPDFQSYRPDSEEATSLENGLNDLMGRDYWHRVWVIQELALAEKAAIVMCGAKQTTIQHLYATCTLIRICMDADRRSYMPRGTGYGRQLESNFPNATPLDIWSEHVYKKNKIRLASILVERKAPSGRPFYSASDPRDILFAMLGLVADTEALGLHVDYTKTTVEAFTSMTRAMIFSRDIEDSSHGFVGCVPRGDKDVCDLALPSWVRDWREMGKYGNLCMPVTTGRQDFNAAGDMMAPMEMERISEDEDKIGRLQWSGCCVDVITEVMQPFEWEWADRSRSWYGSYKSEETPEDAVRKFANLGPEASPGEDYVWRSAECNRFYRDPSSQPMDKPINGDVASLIRKIKRRESIDADSLTASQAEYVRDQYGSTEPDRRDGEETLEECLQMLISGLTNSANFRDRTPFKTIKGMFGMGHVPIKAGDDVVLLCGVDSPVVLRRRDGSDTDFTFLGDAYVDGIMYGEFLETVPSLRNFHIY